MFRRGKLTAAVAVAASVLAAAYCIFLRNVPCHDLGPTFSDRRHEEAIARRLISPLRNLGLKVEIESAA